MFGAANPQGHSLQNMGSQLSGLGRSCAIGLFLMASVAPLDVAGLDGEPQAGESSSTNIDGKFIGMLLGAIIGGALITASVVLLVYCCCCRGEKVQTSFKGKDVYLASSAFTDLEAAETAGKYGQNVLFTVGSIDTKAALKPDEGMPSPNWTDSAKTSPRDSVGDTLPRVEDSATAAITAGEAPTSNPVPQREMRGFASSS